MEKRLLVLGIIIISLFALFYVVSKSNSGMLAANKSGMKRSGDFVLHMRVEQMEGGFQVFRSIQYVGVDPVEITHQTPLVSVTLEHDSHDFTGSPVAKQLNPGNSYHPQDPIRFDSPEKGEYKLYAKARFNVNGKRVVLEHAEDLMFE